MAAIEQANFQTGTMFYQWAVAVRFDYIYENIPQKSFTVDFTSPSYRTDINLQLSSSLSSYQQVGQNSNGERLFTHHENHPERLKTTKQRLNVLRSEMDALRLRQEFDQKRRQDQHTFEDKPFEANKQYEQKRQQDKDTFEEKLEEDKSAFQRFQGAHRSMFKTGY